jgi:hypothetical protein
MTTEAEATRRSALQLTAPGQHARVRVLHRAAGPHGAFEGERMILERLSPMSL